jgi:hypothetical protein
MTTTPTNTPFIAIYQDDIHEVIFQDMKSATLDQYFAYVEEVFKTTPQGQRVNVLLNASSSLPSFQNLSARDRALRAKLKRVPFMRLAILYEKQNHLSFVNMMLRVINMNRHMELQIFPASEKEAAAQWLLR